MSTVQEALEATMVQRAAEQLAEKFHESYERLAPSFSYETRKASAKPWAEVPQNNRRLMVAVVAEVMLPVLAGLETAANVTKQLSNENAALLNAFPEYADPQAKLERAQLRAQLEQLQLTVEEACSAEVDARVSEDAVKLRLRYMAGLQEAGQMVVLRADYERLVASLPTVRLSVVKPEPTDG